ncbi:hypothetical protein Z945_2212 [Sulfitobacter noctilucae]|nr:hypothetical protein Z945_2212 [Sulfitobacter noctilucae]
MRDWPPEERAVDASTVDSETAENAFQMITFEYKTAIRVLENHT